jgi:hypothetical protein
MIFLHIDPKNNEKHHLEKEYEKYELDKNKKLTSLLNDYIKDPNKKIFILFYMEGCGPCGMTRPEWKKIKNVLKKKDDNIIVVDIDHRLIPEIKGLKSEPLGYPTMRFITDGGEFSEDFEDSEVENKNRNIDGFMEWIELKTGAKREKGPEKTKRFVEVLQMDENHQNGGTKQKGGIFIEGRTYESYMNFIKNCQSFRYLSRGSHGFAIIAIANSDYVSSYHNMKPYNFNKPVTELLLKFSLLYDETAGQRSADIYLTDDITNEDKIRTCSIANFENEINIQTDIFLKSINYLQPICPAIVYSSHAYYSRSLIDRLFHHMEEKGDSDTKEVVAFIKSKFGEPSLSNSFTRVGLIAMEFANHYVVLFKFISKPSLETAMVMLMYLLIRLALETGYVHGDHHSGNLLVNPYSNDYFAGISGAPLMIDFGYSKKIPSEYMTIIKRKFQESNMIDILRIIFELGRSDSLSMHLHKNFYGWMAGYWDFRKNKETSDFLPYVNPTLIDLFARREYAITQTVQYFDWLHSKDPDEYPLLPLSNAAKNKMFEGMIYGGSKKRHNKTRKRKGGKWSLKYKKSINCKKPKGFSQKQYCKYGRK